MGVGLGFIAHLPLFINFDPFGATFRASPGALDPGLSCSMTTLHLLFFVIFKRHENAFIATCLHLSEYFCVDPVVT